MTKNYFLDFSKVDMDELTSSVDRSILSEISKRPQIRLDNDMTYIKNRYEYFKDTPTHYLNPKNENNLKTKKWDEYPFLDSFDGDEFEDFLAKSGKDIMETAPEFLDAHIDLAKKRNDYKALFDSISSKAFYYAFNNDFKNALREEVKLFIVRLNPSCDESQLIFHEHVNQVNINNLTNLIIVCKIEDIEDIFNHAWQSLELKKIYHDRNESHEILTEALSATDLDSINCDIEGKYFRN